MRTLCTGIFILLITTGAAAYADIYKYVDENGVIYYTNVPQGKDYKRVVTEKRKTSDQDHYNEIIHTKSTKYGVEPSLVKAIITAESNWSNNAVSNKGAMGLMQLMPSTAKDMEVDNPFDPEENIEGGVRYLRFLLDRFNDVPLALAAYNAGPRTVEESGGIPSISETKHYVKKVLSLYKDTPNTVSRAQIYKVTLEDGTVLFTNTPFAYRSFKVSRF